MGDGSGPKVNFDGLREIAQKLHTTSDHLQGPAQQAPRSIDAGPSSAAISGALSEIMRAAGAVLATAAGTGEKVNTNNASYGEVENTNTDSLNKQRGQLGG